MPVRCAQIKETRPRAPKTNESSTPGFRPGREPWPATSRESAATRSQDRRRVAKTHLPRHPGCRWSLTPAIKAGFTALHSSASRRTAPPARASIPLGSTVSNHRRQASPGAMRAAAFAKSHQPASRASGTFVKLPPSRRPQIQSGLCRPCKPPAIASPATIQATARVSPGRQTPEQRDPAPTARRTPQKDLLRVGVALGVRSVAFAQHSIAAECRPTDREPGEATLSAGPRRRA
jgi:hypothetical protein